MGSRSPQDPDLATTAPYYQPLRAYPNGSLEGHGYGAADDEYAIAQQLAPQAPMYPGTSQDQNVLDGYGAQGQHVLADQQLDSHDQFAGLLEAVKSVGQEEAAFQSGAGRHLRRSTGAAELEHDDGAFGAQRGKSKRKRASSERVENHDEEDDFSTGERDSRRKRGKRGSTANAADTGTPGASTDFACSAIGDARAAGVHSAAALFRQPSASAAKKYTRPPMSKLYSSLNLSPENFLHLQAAAKAYMLDPAHPERQNCVGNRGKGDTDMVKLRLFNCVRDFLADGIGEKFFSEEASGAGPDGNGDGAGFGEDGVPLKKWVWPRDGNKIVSLVTPLLRRMVTNERQRQYAVETRKGGAGKKGKNGGNDEDASMLDQPGGGEGEDDQWAAEHQPNLDPSLGQSGYHTSAEADLQRPTPAANVVQIYFLRGNEAILPRLDIPSPPGASHVLSFAELQHVVSQQLNGVPRLLLDLHEADAHAAARGADAGPREHRLQQADGQGRARDRGLLDAQAITAARALAATAADADADASGANGAGGAGGSVDGTDDPAHEALFDAAAAEQPHPRLHPAVRAAGARGLVEVRGEREWEGVKAEVAGTVWLEGVVKVVVEVGAA